MTLADILAPYGLTDEEYVAELAQALESRPGPTAAGLSPTDQTILKRHSGVTVYTSAQSDVGRAWLGNITANLAAQLEGSLTVAETAVMLGISHSRVRHRVHEGGLYAFKMANQLRLPVWQFHNEQPLPGLRKVLVVLDQDLHPLEVAGFMTSPDEELVLAADAVAPRDWLISGGDPAAVAHLAALIGAGW